MSIGKRSFLRWGVAALLAAAGTGLAAQQLRSSGAVPAVATVAVTTGDVEQAVLATGTMEAATLVSVGAQVSGQVTALRVELGDAVRKGDLIAEIDSVPQRNALRNAEASLDNVRAQRRAQAATVEQTRLAFRRQARMLAGNATARGDYEAAEAAFKTAEAQGAALDAQIVQAEIEVETARVNVGYTRITAPMDGTVVAIVTKQGQTVNANQTTPTIVKLARLAAMLVKAKISEADVTKVRPGQEIHFTILGEPDHRFATTLKSVEPAPDSIKTDTTTTSSGSSGSDSTATAIYYNGLLEVPNPDGRLRISMTAQVSIVLARAKGVPTVPAAALGDRGADGAYAVQVQEADGQVVKRAVRIGVTDGVTAEVLSGLTPGERVVIGQALPAVASQDTGRRGPPPPMGF